MDLETLYEEMKNAITSLGLSWRDKDKISVRIRGKELIFSYDKRSVAVLIK